MKIRAKIQTLRRVALSLLYFNAIRYGLNVFAGLGILLESSLCHPPIAADFRTNAQTLQGCHRCNNHRLKLFMSCLDVVLL